MFLFKCLRTNIKFNEDFELTLFDLSNYITLKELSDISDIPHEFLTISYNKLILIRKK